MRRIGLHRRRCGGYLLLINKRKQEKGEKALWAPRSCHFSIHAIRTRVMNEKGDSMSVVGPGDGQPIDTFLAQLKSTAETAKKEPGAK